MPVDQLLDKSHKPARQRVNDGAYWLQQGTSEGWRPCVGRFLQQIRQEEAEIRRMKAEAEENEATHTRMA